MTFPLRIRSVRMTMNFSGRRKVRLRLTYNHRPKLFWIKILNETKNINNEQISGYTHGCQRLGKCQERINYFQVREKSGNFTLSRGKNTSSKEVRENLNFKWSCVGLFLCVDDVTLRFVMLCYLCTLLSTIDRFLTSKWFPFVMQVRFGLWMKS